MDELDRLLTSVGMKSFVDHYKEYRDLYSISDSLKQVNKKKLAEKLLNSNPEANSLQAQITRVNKAIKIFEKGYEKSALDKIAKSNHFKITEDTKSKAIGLISEFEI